MGFAKTRQNQRGFIKGEKGRRQRVQDAKPETLPPRTPVLGLDVRDELQHVPVDSILEPPGTPDRQERPGDQEATRQLAESLRECGQLQPILVERLEDGRLVRVFGRRRLAAARLLGWASVLAVVTPPLSPDARRTIVAVENVQRLDLSPAEETLAVDDLLHLQAFAAARQLGKLVGPMCGGLANLIITKEIDDKIKGDLRAASAHDLLNDPRVRAIAVELVAAMLGKPASWVRDRMYIGRLSDKAKALVRDGQLPLAHAREIAKMADAQMREALAIDYAAGGCESLSDAEAGSLDDLKDEVRRGVFSLHVVPWDRNVPFAGKPACVECPHNSCNTPGLFEHGGAVSTRMVAGLGDFDSACATHERVQEAGICTLPSCYQTKLRESKNAIANAAKRIVDGEKSKAEARVPAFVDPKALEAKVKDRRASVKAAGKRPIGSGSAPASAKDKAQEAAKKARDEAIGKWENAMSARARSLTPKLAKALAKTPGAWAMLSLFRESKMYAASQGGASKGERIVRSPGMASLLKHLAAPSMEGVLAMEKECGRQFDLLEPWYDGRSGMADAIAKAMGIDLGPIPTVEDFLPKPKARGDSASSAGPSEKPAARGSRKRSGAKASSEPEGDKDIEPSGMSADDGEEER